MIVEEATTDDLAGISALETAFPERDRWSVEAWREELEAPDRHVLVGRLAGTGEIVGAATFQRAGHMVDLHRIVVAPGHRRRGLARVMLLTGLHWARRSGAERMLLEVDEDNTGAIRLYRDFGFTTISQREDYYGPGRHARICELDLSEQPPDTPWAHKEQP